MMLIGVMLASTSSSAFSVHRTHRSLLWLEIGRPSADILEAPAIIQIST